MSKGFTLIELMISISIVSIMLLIGVFSTKDILIKNRVNSKIDSIAQALRFARNEAILKNKVITFCKSKDHKTCSGTWNDGQIIKDDSGNIIRVFQAIPKKDKLTWKSSFNKDDFLKFENTGQTLNGQRGTFVYCPHESQRAKSIIISQTGRIRVSDKLSDGTKIVCKN